MEDVRLRQQFGEGAPLGRLAARQAAGAVEGDVRLRVQRVALEDDELRVDAAPPQRLGRRPRDAGGVDGTEDDAQRPAVSARTGRAEGGVVGPVFVGAGFVGVAREGEAVEAALAAEAVFAGERRKAGLAVKAVFAGERWKAGPAAEAVFAAEAVRAEARGQAALNAEAVLRLAPVERMAHARPEPDTDTSHLRGYGACARAPGGWGFGMVVNEGPSLRRPTRAGRSSATPFDPA